MEREPTDALADLDDVLIQALNLREETENVILLDFVYKSKPPRHIAQQYRDCLLPIRSVSTYVNQFEHFTDILNGTTRTVRDTLYNLFSEVDELNVRARIISKWPDGFDGDDDRVFSPTPFIPSGAPMPVLSF